jgi:hypothetical protein
VHGADNCGQLKNAHVDLSFPGQCLTFAAAPRAPLRVNQQLVKLSQQRPFHD